ncbi:pyridoxal phosphate-dependent aminotransferase [Flavobacterium caeni]|uniref:Aminotransferase n=1 Tax=Flavobacterium caeni TaxID=490189 RepID=A0A1G5JSV5_9FLAO|nr:aminotransferase class I/II-fold pyridoxal phosphate-dependent enzyme [Flavobacterium caeni]SCY91475.1 Aspartate/methionine/tyrosine aminotransferase [Flavobacterium caeni]
MITAKRLSQVGEYYFSAKLKEVRQLAASGKSVINMGIGSPDLPPSSSVIDAMVSALSQPGAHQYQSYQGLPELRRAMQSFYHEHFNVALDADAEILPLMGSKEGIVHISLAFLNEGDQVLIPNPGYPTYVSATHLAGGEPVFYDLEQANDWQPDFDALEKSDLSKVKLMWVNYPHMPTGATGSLALFEKLVDFAKRNEILIVNDNPYSFILNDNPISILQVDGAKEVALELNSLSKTFNIPGWRVGMVLGNPQLLDAILKVKSNMDSGMFYALQKGAAAALQSDADWFESQNTIYGQRRDLIFELATALGCTFDRNAVGLFVWAKLQKNVASAESFIDDILYNQHVFITPGTVFGSQGEGYIRFSLCVPEDQIKQAIERIKNRQP